MNVTDFENQIERWLGTEPITVFDSAAEIEDYFCRESLVAMFGSIDESDSELEEIKNLSLQLWVYEVITNCLQNGSVDELASEKFNTDAKVEIKGKDVFIDLGDHCATIEQTHQFVEWIQFR